MKGLMTELKRKSFHALSASYALLYALTSRSTTLFVLGGLLVVVGLIENLRLAYPELNRKLLGYFGGIHREEEEEKFSGVFWTLLGCVLTIFIIPEKNIVLAAMWYLILGDGLAALVGQTYGTLRVGHKSLEGSLACFISCWVVGMVFLPNLPGSNLALFGAMVATIIEAVPLPLNDNFWLPLLSGLALWGMVGG